MIMVVFIHSYNLVLKFNSSSLVSTNQYNTFVQGFISGGLARISVPIFFLISGFLFFYNTSLTSELYIQKLNKRIKTLLIPYLIWSFWGLLFFWGLQSMPYSSQFFRNQPIRQLSGYEIILKLFVNPLPYQLWFMQNLIFLVLLTPIIQLTINKLSYLILVPILSLYFLNKNLYIITGEALLFFTLGSFLAIKKVVVNRLWIKRTSIILSIIWILILIIRVLVIKEPENGPFIKVANLIGIVAVWGLYDLFLQNVEFSSKWYFELFSFSFFIYAFHEPVMTIIKKMLFYILGFSEINVLLIYFLSPFLTILISLFFAMLFKKYQLRFYNLITGNR
nr:acyltransferase family protein [Sporocytophaga sp.]